MEVACKWKGQTGSNGLTAFGVFLSLEGASTIVLLRVISELRRAPDSPKAIVCIAFTVWASYLAFIASHALRQTAFWREQAAQTLVLAYGVALPLLLTVLESSIIMQRGYPCIEAILVTGFNVKLQLLPLRGMLAQHFLYLLVHMACCLWRALPLPLSSSSLAWVAGYVAANTTVSAVVCSLMCLARNRQSVLDAPHNLQDSQQQEAAQGRAADGHAITAGRSSREFHSKDSKEGASQGHLHGEQHDHAVQKGLLEHRVLRRMEQWLLDAVPEYLAETILAYVCSTYVSFYFFGSCVNYVQPDTLKSSPTFEMLALMLAMFWCSSDAQQQKHVAAAQARAYQIVCGVLNGLLPAHIARHIVEGKNQSLRNQGNKDKTRGVQNTLRHSTGGTAVPKTLEKGATTGQLIIPSQPTGLLASADCKPTAGPQKGANRGNDGAQSCEHTDGSRVQASSISSPCLKLRRALIPKGLPTWRPLSPNATAPKLQSAQSLSSSSQAGSGACLEPNTLYSEKHESVTVCFSDIVGFTTLSEQLSPTAVMALLADLYAKFDALADEMGLYTVDNVGDCYMVAANLIHPIENHAQAAVEFAARMIRIAQSTRSPLGQPLSVRVGVHTGPVMSGVLGMRRMKFTLVGDTVNCASRMESSGLKDSIQVSEETYRHLLRHRGRSSSPCMGLEQLSHASCNMLQHCGRISSPGSICSSHAGISPSRLGLTTTCTHLMCGNKGDAELGADPALCQVDPWLGTDRATAQGDVEWSTGHAASQGEPSLGIFRAASFPEARSRKSAGPLSLGEDVGGVREAEQEAGAALGGQQIHHHQQQQQQQQAVTSKADQCSMRKTTSRSRHAAALIDEKHGRPRSKSLGRSISSFPSWSVPHAAGPCVLTEGGVLTDGPGEGVVHRGWVARWLDVKGKGRMHTCVLTLGPPVHAGIQAAFCAEQDAV